MSSYPLPLHVITRDVSDGWSGALHGHFSDEEPNDVSAARAQHQAVLHEFATRSISIENLPADHNSPDCVFVEDHAVIVGNRALATRPGAPSRRGESPPVHRALADYVEVIHMEDGGTVDGGDVLVLPDMVLAGRSRRTNDDGLNQLESFVLGSGRTFHVIEVPSFSLHLISICTSPAPGHLLISEGWPLSSFHGVNAHIHRLPFNQSYGANVIALGEDILLAEGFPAASEVIQKLGLRPIPLNMDEIRRADGSLTCLSLRIYTTD
mgnify:CR=1 FL=1